MEWTCDLNLILPLHLPILPSLKATLLSCPSLLLIMTVYLLKASTIASVSQLSITCSPRLTADQISRSTAHAS